IISIQYLAHLFSRSVQICPNLSANPQPRRNLNCRYGVRSEPGRRRLDSQPEPLDDPPYLVVFLQQRSSCAVIGSLWIGSDMGRRQTHGLSPAVRNRVHLNLKGFSLDGRSKPVLLANEIMNALGGEEHLSPQKRKLVDLLTRANLGRRTRIRGGRRAGHWLEATEAAPCQ